MAALQGKQIYPCFLHLSYVIQEVAFESSPAVLLLNRIGREHQSSQAEGLTPATHEQATRNKNRARKFCISAAASLQ